MVTPYHPSPLPQNPNMHQILMKAITHHHQKSLSRTKEMKKEKEKTKTKEKLNLMTRSTLAA